MTTTALCGNRAYSCQCCREAGHDGPHRCEPVCGGSWTYDEHGDFMPVDLPTPAYFGAATMREGVEPHP
jgi:hypothetical protein